MIELFFSRKRQLKKEFDDKLVRLIKETKDNYHNAKVMEELMDDYNLDVIVQRKIAESVHFYLFKEARIRQVILK